MTAPYEYEAVTAVISCGGYTFTAKGKTTLCEGWREIEKLSRAASEEQDEDAEPETVLPPLAEGQTFDNPAAEISECYTHPESIYRRYASVRYGERGQGRNAGGRRAQRVRHYRNAGGYH